MPRVVLPGTGPAAVLTGSSHERGGDKHLRERVHYVGSPPLAPDGPDQADAGPLLPLELLGWDASDRLVGGRCTGGEVVLRSGRPPVRRTLAVQRLTRWVRAGRLTLHASHGDVEVRLLDPREYVGLSLGDVRSPRLAGPLRMVRSGRLAGLRDRVADLLVARVLAVRPDVQVMHG